MSFFKGKGTIKSKDVFTDAEAETVAKSFDKAMEGFGTDEKRITKEIIAHTNAERQLIKQKYEVMYGKTLEEDLIDELQGEYENVVIALLKPRLEYEAECVRKAIHRIGTNETALIDILCTKDPSEIDQLKETYAKMYDSDLEKDIRSEEDGALGRIMRSLASGDRSRETKVDKALAQAEAKQLYEAGVGSVGTEESDFVRILCSRSFPQLKATFDEYQKLADGVTLEQSVQKEFECNAEDALYAIIKCIRDRSSYFAERLYESTKGAGTRDQDLIRILVSRAEVDLNDIKDDYRQLFKRELIDDLKRELKGNYEDIIVALVGKK